MNRLDGEIIIFGNFSPNLFDFLENFEKMCTFDFEGRINRKPHSTFSR